MGYFALLLFAVLAGYSTQSNFPQYWIVVSAEVQLFVSILFKLKRSSSIGGCVSAFLFAFDAILVPFNAVACLAVFSYSTSLDLPQTPLFIASVASVAGLLIPVISTYCKSVDDRFKLEAYYSELIGTGAIVPLMQSLQPGDDDV